MSNWQKIIKYLALVFAVCLTVFIVTTIFDVAVEVIDGITGHGGKSVTDTYTYDNIKSLDVEMGLGDVVIRSQGDDFIVKVNEVLGFEIKEKSGDLKIETGSRSFGSNGENSSLEIIVPENCRLENFKVEIGAGTCTIDGISTENADFDTGAGKLICNNLDVNNCKTDSGVGSVTLSLTGSMEDYSIILDKGIGSADIDGESYSEDKHKNSRADRKLDIDCGIGSIEIDFEN